MLKASRNVPCKQCISGVDTGANVDLLYSMREAATGPLCVPCPNRVKGTYLSRGWLNILDQIIPYMLLVASLANRKWCENPEKWLKPWPWVLIWEYLVRAIQWIPTWQGLDGFQKYLCPCSSDESILSIGRVKASRNISCKPCIRSVDTGANVDLLYSMREAATGPLCVPCLNPSNAKTTFIQSTNIQRFLKNI